VSGIDDPPSLVARDVRFRDRRDAGRQLAAPLERFREARPVVVGIPRGGVPVAAEVARALAAPLDVTVVRKIGAPQNPEYAIGALAEGGVRVLSEQAVRAVGLSERELAALAAQVEDELARRLARYRGAEPPVALQGRTAILVDDGLATGRSALAAVRSLRKRGAARVILAVPVAAPESARLLRRHTDEIVCLHEPQDLWAVGFWYEDFRPTTDEDVAATLAERAREGPAGSAGRDGASVAAMAGGARAGTASAAQLEVAIPAGPDLLLDGELALPARALGVVAFAHGSGSSRLSPRNRSVARALNEAGFATLLLDLLTPAEELDRGNVFDVELLAARLDAARAWLAGRDDLTGLALAYFGASTGAAAALTAAAERPAEVAAVISRGGRPDLARDLGAVRAPTLLIVGGADSQVVELNRQARERLRCVNELALVPGATHLFEEPGALEQVADLAIEWLRRHLPAPAAGEGVADAAEER
jgi:putative phosphoribosyl transferase